MNILGAFDRPGPRIIFGIHTAKVGTTSGLIHQRSAGIVPNRNPLRRVCRFGYKIQVTDSADFGGVYYLWRALRRVIPPELLPKRLWIAVFKQAKLTIDIRKVLETAFVANLND